MIFRNQSKGIRPSGQGQFQRRVPTAEELGYETPAPGSDSDSTPVPAQPRQRTPAIKPQNAPDSVIVSFRKQTGGPTPQQQPQRQDQPPPPQNAQIVAIQILAPADGSSFQGVADASGGQVASVAIRGTATPGAVVAVSLDGSAIASVTSSLPSVGDPGVAGGEWSVQVQGVPAGAHIARASAPGTVTHDVHFTVTGAAGGGTSGTSGITTTEIVLGLGLAAGLWWMLKGKGK